jgi:hypothetical protein
MAGKTKCLALTVLVGLGLPGVKAHASVEPGIIEVIAYFQTSLPPEEGTPVCLTGVSDPIGILKTVRVVPERARNHDRWEVVMWLDERYAAKIPADAVARAKSIEPNENCGGSSGEFVVEINTTISAWGCHSSGFCATPTRGSPIENHGLLKGEVTYGATIAWLLPPTPWWKDWTVYLVMVGGVFGYGCWRRATAKKRRPMLLLPG